MTDHPSPEDARRLLEGTTPGPWAVEGSYIMDRYRSQIITLLGDMAEAYPEAEADARLVAAAPALAAALAEHEAGGCAGCARVEALAAAREARAEAAALRTEREALREAILDIDAHATPFGEDEHGFVSGGYLISVGSLHRALGIIGHTAPKCSPERPCLPCAMRAIDVDRLRSALTAARDFIKGHPAVSGEWPVLIDLIERTLARTDTGGQG